MEITEVRIALKDERKLKAFASITFDNVFVVRGLKVINGSQGYFVSMPSRRKKDGTFQDLAHPINNDLRKKIEDRVLDAFESELNLQGSAEGSGAESAVRDGKREFEDAFNKQPRHCMDRAG